MPDRGRAILYTGVVFAAGMIAGALLMNLGEHLWLHRGRHAPIPASSSAIDRHVIEQFKTELKLTEAQSQQLETILDETVRQYHDLRSFSYHIREEGIARIRAMLDDNQRKRFDEIVKGAVGQKKGPKPLR